MHFINFLDKEMFLGILTKYISNQNHTLEQNYMKINIKHICKILGVSAFSSLNSVSLYSILFNKLTNTWDASQF